MQTKIYLLFLLLPFLSYGQQVKISAAPDRSEMKIGEQIHYKIAVEADSTARVSLARLLWILSRSVTDSD